MILPTTILGRTIVTTFTRAVAARAGPTMAWSGGTTIMNHSSLILKRGSNQPNENENENDIDDDIGPPPTPRDGRGPLKIGIDFEGDVENVRRKSVPPVAAEPLTSLHSQLANMQHEDPDMVFEAVDRDHDGLITQAEFGQALERLHYEEIKQIHRTIHGLIEEQSMALQNKLDTVLTIEEELLELAAVAQQKQGAYYDSIGMMTAADIDVLFAKSKLKRDQIGQSVQRLKGLIEDAKSAYHHAWDSPIM